MSGLFDSTVFEALLQAQPNRREFLQTAALGLGTLFVPIDLCRKRYWFLHTPTGNSWQVDDPVTWSLAHAKEPILARARERLEKVDGQRERQRLIRLVVRRCQLNLIVVLPGSVTVHYWGQQGCGDLRPYFKHHGLARINVAVVLIDRKRELVARKPGDDFLYGEWLPEEFSVELFARKWERRGLNEPDDWTAAPGTESGFMWEGLEPDQIPWAALKSAWRWPQTQLCPNCDRPTILRSFGQRRIKMGAHRVPAFRSVCLLCQRDFDGPLIRDVPQWLVQHLDHAMLPSFELFRIQPVKWQTLARTV